MSISSPPEQSHPAFRPSAPSYVPAGAKKGSTGQKIGPFQGIFHARPISKGEIFVLTVWLFMAVILPISYGIWLDYETYTKYGPAAIPSQSYPWLLTAACGLLLWFLILFLRRRDSRRMVAIHRHGLLLLASRRRNPHPRTLRSIPWDQISGITIEVTVRPSSRQKREDFMPVVTRARIDHLQGKPLRLCRGEGLFQGMLRWQSMPGLAELITRTKASYYQHIFPRLKASMSEGEFLNFGPISIHRQYFQLRPRGLFRTPTSIPWNGVQHITIRSGRLVIELLDQNCTVITKSIPIGQIPNLELMMRLIDQYAK